MAQAFLVAHGEFYFVFFGPYNFWGLMLMHTDPKSEASLRVTLWTR